MDESRWVRHATLEGKIIQFLFVEFILTYICNPQYRSEISHANIYWRESQGQTQLSMVRYLVSTLTYVGSYCFLRQVLIRSVTARIGFSVDSDLHEKSLCRIRSRWCKNHVELDICFCFRSFFFWFSIQNEFVVRSKTLSPILHGETVIKLDLCCMKNRI